MADSKPDFSKQISSELGISPRQVFATLSLLNEGATIPFLARYRKEATGSLDEVDIMRIRDRNQQLDELESRRKTILSSIEEQGKMTPELRRQIIQAVSSSQLEDIYLPYRPKRRTRATDAKEKGLEPLADTILTKQHSSSNMHIA